MRWDDLFADLDAQALGLELAERAGEIAERTRHEVGRVSLVDRLLAARDTEVSLAMGPDLHLAGAVRRVGPDWLLLHENAGRESVIALARVTHIRGLSARVAPGLGAVASRWDLRMMLRAIVRDRSVVRLHLAQNAVLDGTIDRVAADHLDLAVHAAGEMRRREAVREVLVVPLASVVALRRAVG
jgi:hypothetical protein